MYVFYLYDSSCILFSCACISSKITYVYYGNIDIALNLSAVECLVASHLYTLASLSVQFQLITFIDRLKAKHIVQ